LLLLRRLLRLLRAARGPEAAVSAAAAGGATVAACTDCEAAVAVCGTAACFSAVASSALSTGPTSSFAAAIVLFSSRISSSSGSSELSFVGNSSDFLSDFTCEEVASDWSCGLDEVALDWAFGLEMVSSDRSFGLAEIGLAEADLTMEKIGAATIEKRSTCRTKKTWFTNESKISTKSESTANYNTALYL
jgi:hypothetical protein